MKEITLPKASQLTSPNPVTVVCTRKPDGSTNLATVSWWTYLSYNPGMIAYAMAKPSYSGERVRESGQVILTIPGAAIADAVLGCGTTTAAIPTRPPGSTSSLRRSRAAPSGFRPTAVWPSCAA